MKDLFLRFAKAWKEKRHKKVSFSRKCEKYGLIEHDEPYIHLCDLKTCTSCRILEKVISWEVDEEFSLDSDETRDNT